MNIKLLNGYTNDYIIVNYYDIIDYKPNIRETGKGTYYHKVLFKPEAEVLGGKGHHAESKYPINRYGWETGTTKDEIEQQVNQQKFDAKIKDILD